MVEIGPNLFAGIVVASICAWGSVRAWASRPAKPAEQAPAKPVNNDKLARDIADLRLAVHDLQAAVDDMAGRKATEEDWPPVAVPGGSLREVAK